MFAPITLGLWSKKNFLLLRNWVHFVPTFLKLFSQLFSFMVQLTDSTEVKTVLLIRFFDFHPIRQSEIDKMFEDKKI
jgi:hypothetical protein